MKNFKIVKVGGTPFEIGYDYGKECKAEIQFFIKEALPKVISFGNDIDLNKIAEMSIDYEPHIKKAAPHLIEEIRGIGEGAGISYQEALMLQCRSELVYMAKMNWTIKSEVKGQLECSSFGISRERSFNNKVIIGQNVDMGKGLEELGLILCIYPKKGPSIITWTLAGTLGQVGLNSSGLARCGNVLISPGWRIGLPTTVLFRLILEMPTTYAVKKLLQDSYRAKSNNFLMGDKSGEIIDIETTATDYRILYSQDGIITHTNHYIHPDFIENENFYNLDNSKIRMNCMQNLFAEAPNKIGIDYLKHILANHDTDPNSICAHNSGNPKDSKTIVSVIMSPEEGTMLACPGNPCTGEFKEYNL